MTSDFKDEFQRLWGSKNPEKRGLAFEKLFCRLLFKSGFEVLRNPEAAKPRQTDLLAEYSGDTFLFEMKWLERKLDVEAIAQITDRLRRTPKGTVGCICSVSGFTETLIKDVEDFRSQHEIVLFNPYEIYGLFVERLSIGELIERKRRALKQDGAMWFFGQDAGNSRSRYVELPPSDESLNLPGRSIHLRYDSQHLSDIVFARAPLFFNECFWAFSLRVRLNSASVEGLRETFFAAENYLGLQGTGTFGIRQQASGWCGLGSDNFLAEIARHPQRYKRYKDSIHHSEELVFFDELRSGGIFLLTARQSLTREGWIHSGQVIIRLPGVPTNTEPYNRFIRSVTRDNVLFTPEQPLTRHHTRLLPNVRVELRDVIGMIGSTRISHACVSGVVVRNPFFHNPAKISELSKDEELLAFSEPEYLVCGLDDWLDAGDEVDYYVLTGLEAVSLDDAVLLHPRCTWGNLTKRARPLGGGNGFQKTEEEWKRRDRMEKKIKAASERKRR